MSPWLWKEQKISRIIEAPFIHQFSEWMQTGALFYTYTKPQTLQTRIARLFIRNRRSFSCKPRPDLWNFRLYPLWSWAFASSGWMMLWFFIFFPSELLAKLFHIKKKNKWYAQSCSDIDMVDVRIATVCTHVHAHTHARVRHPFSRR